MKSIFSQSFDLQPLVGLSLSLSQYIKERRHLLFKCRSRAESYPAVLRRLRHGAVLLGRAAHRCMLPILARTDGASLGVESECVRVALAALLVGWPGVMIDDEASLLCLQGAILK